MNVRRKRFLVGLDVSVPGQVVQQGLYVGHNLAGVQGLVVPPHRLAAVVQQELLEVPPEESGKCVGDEGVIARNTDFSYMSIFSQVFGVPAPVLLLSTHCTHCTHCTYSYSLSIFIVHHLNYVPCASTLHLT